MPAKGCWWSGLSRDEFRERHEQERRRIQDDTRQYSPSSGYSGSAQAKLRSNERAVRRSAEKTKDVQRLREKLREGGHE